MVVKMMMDDGQWTMGGGHEYEDDH